ncbi:AMP-binding enzyme [Burkholderia sp. WSM2230]|uniref:AMP-binding enzyme n=1 Tax=Burkholderia sp. WSM2230 TaxID=944435 RepID=UPI0004726237|nr:hypothetical protein [Burkholderia sp. WSM2230]
MMHTSGRSSSRHEGAGRAEEQRTIPDDDINDASLNSIRQHPAVVDVAAYAVKSELSEEEVAVSVVLKDGHALPEAELIAFCATKMAYYLVPRYVKYASELPLNASQKIEKFKLRQQAAEFPETLWDREKAGVLVER